MAIYASPSMRGFYDDAIHASLPDDAIEISAEQHAALLAGQSAGKIIDWSGDTPLLADPPLPTPAEQRTALLTRINTHAATQLAALSASYPDGEVQSWAQQVREAEALAANANAPAPLLSAIGRARAVPVAELAARVLAKTQAYALASGAIIGKRQAREDAIAAIDLDAPDAAAQLEAITWDGA